MLDPGTLSSMLMFQNTQLAVPSIYSKAKLSTTRTRVLCIVPATY